MDHRHHDGYYLFAGLRLFVGLRDRSLLIGVLVSGGGRAL
jgi:hypothetical protein